MADASEQGLAARRAAAVCVDNLGLSNIVLRFPTSALVSDAEELGLAGLDVVETVLGSALITREKDARTTVVVAAEVAEEALHLHARDGVLQALRDVASVRVDDVEMLMESATSVDAGGVTILYKMTLRETAARL